MQFTEKQQTTSKYLTILYTNTSIKHNTAFLTCSDVIDQFLPTAHPFIPTFTIFDFLLRFWSGWLSPRDKRVKNYARESFIALTSSFSSLHALFRVHKNRVTYSPGIMNPRWFLTYLIVSARAAEKKHARLPGGKKSQKKTKKKHAPRSTAH